MELLRSAFPNALWSHQQGRLCWTQGLAMASQSCESVVITIASVSMPLVWAFLIGSRKYTLCMLLPPTPSPSHLCQTDLPIMRFSGALHMQHSKQTGQASACTLMRPSCDKCSPITSKLRSTAGSRSSKTYLRCYSKRKEQCHNFQLAEAVVG